MGFIDTTPPNEWGVWKWIAIIGALVLIISVHLEFEWWEIESWDGKHRDENPGSEYTGAAWLYTFAGMFALLLLFVGYDIEVALPDRRMRINELLIIPIAAMIFLHSLGNIWRVTDYYENDMPDCITGGPGYGLYLAFICSILLMVSAFMLWKRREDSEWESSPAPVKTTAASPIVTAPEPAPQPKPAPKPEPAVEVKPEPTPATPAPEAAPPAQAAEDEGLSKTAAFKKEVEKDDKLPPPPWITREEEEK